MQKETTAIETRQRGTNAIKDKCKSRQMQRNKRKRDNGNNK